MTARHLLFILLKHGLLPVAGGFLAVTLFSAVPSADAQGVPAVVTARGFRLVDAQGVARALIEVDNKGEAHLVLADAAGTRRVVLGASTGQAGLTLLDPKKTARYTLLQTEKDDRVTQTFLNAQGKEGLLTALTREHNALIAFLGPKAGKWLTLMTGPEQASTLILKDPKTPMKVVTFAGKGQASVQTNDAAGKAGFLASTLQDGRSVTALSHDGKLRMRTMTGNDGTAAIALYDATRKETWKAGK